MTIEELSNQALLDLYCEVVKMRHYEAFDEFDELKMNLEKLKTSGYYIEKEILSRMS